jgi:lipoprotein-releasing system permease protein
MARIRRHPFLKDRIAAMTATMEVFAMLQLRLPSGEMMTRAVRLLGIDTRGRTDVGGFSEHLVRQKDSPNPTFEPSAEALEQYYRRNVYARPLQPLPVGPEDPGQPPPAPPPSQTKVPRGAIVGNLIANYRDKDREVEVIHPGDQIILATVSGQRLGPVYDHFVVVDYFKSEMSEYDSNYVFVPLDYLQHLRTMQDRVTSIQIRLKDYAEAKEVVKALQAVFADAGNSLDIQTWEEKQGPLLKAIAIEKGILNVLLFLIIGVAGFGILAIFSMIVTEKTRDIGILKALGASNGGVMLIFLGYGLLLGVVGAGLGTSLGLTLTNNINNIEKGLARVTGQEIFDRAVYYFNEIPTDVQPWNVVLVALGAVAIAVLFSVLPALRAALLHPVRALRYE